MNIKESKLSLFLIPAGIVLIVFSIFMFISAEHNKNYIETEATVSRIVLAKEETFDIDGNLEPAEYDTYVKYTVDGTEYEELLAQMPKLEIGRKMKIVYDPNNPKNISQPASPILNLVLLVGGIAAVIAGIVIAIKKGKQSKEEVTD